MMSDQKKSASGRLARMRAVEALKVLLREMSAIKLKEIDLGSPGKKGEIDILAHIDVFGHSHTLACGLQANGEAQRVGTALDTLLDGVTRLPEKATPVIIAPYLSPEAQALCAEKQTGYLDMQGNARIVVDEVFISKRSLPCAAPGSSRASTGSGRRGVEGNTDRSVLDGIAPAGAECPFCSFRVATRVRAY
jgi:hypothetical protein